MWEELLLIWGAFSLFSLHFSPLMVGSYHLRRPICESNCLLEGRSDPQITETDISCWCVVCWLCKGFPALQTVCAQFFKLNTVVKGQNKKSRYSDVGVLYCSYSTSHHHSVPWKLIGSGHIVKALLESLSCSKFKHPLETLWYLSKF